MKAYVEVDPEGFVVFDRMGVPSAPYKHAVDAIKECARLNRNGDARTPTQTGGVWTYYLCAAVIFFILIAGALRGCGETLLDRIEQRESGCNPHAIGDQGRARGSFQFWEITWRDVSRRRSQEGLPTWDYSLATNRVIARIYAAYHIRLLRASLTSALGQPPTTGQVYAAWTHGLRGFQRRGFSTRKIAL